MFSMVSVERVKLARSVLFHESYKSNFLRVCMWNNKNVSVGNLRDVSVIDSNIGNSFHVNIKSLNVGS